MASGITFVTEFNDPTTGKFRNNTTKNITAQYTRDLVTRIEDSFLNLNDDAYTGVKAVAPGIVSIAELRLIPTAGSTIVLIGVLLMFRKDSDGAFRAYKLISGTAVESGEDIVRPNDFNITTNPKIWVLAFTGGSVGPITAVTVTVDDSAFSEITGTNVQDALDSIDNILAAIPAGTLDAVLTEGNDATSHDITNAGTIYHLPNNGPDVIPGTSDPLFCSTDPKFGESAPGLFGELGGAPNTLNVGVSAEIIRMGKTGTKLLLTSDDGTEWYFSISNLGIATVVAV